MILLFSASRVHRDVFSCHWSISWYGYSRHQVSQWSRSTLGLCVSIATAANIISTCSVSLKSAATETSENISPTFPCSFFKANPVCLRLYTFKYFRGAPSATWWSRETLHHTYRNMTKVLTGCTSDSIRPLSASAGLSGTPKHRKPPTQHPRTSCRRLTCSEGWPQARLLLLRSHRGSWSTFCHICLLNLCATVNHNQAVAAWLCVPSLREPHWIPIQAFVFVRNHQMLGVKLLVDRIMTELLLNVFHKQLLY